MKYPEHAMQCAFFEWLAYAYPVARKTAFAIPNGSQKTAQEGLRAKRSGLTAGVPDIAIMTPNGTSPGLFIEMKIKPNKPSVAQVAMIANLKAQGYTCYVCYTLDEAVNVTTQYLLS